MFVMQRVAVAVAHPAIDQIAADIAQGFKERVEFGMEEGCQSPSECIAYMQLCYQAFGANRTVSQVSQPKGSTGGAGWDTALGENWLFGPNIARGRPGVGLKD